MNIEELSSIGCEYFGSEVKVINLALMQIRIYHYTTRWRILLEYIIIALDWDQLVFTSIVFTL